MGHSGILSKYAEWFDLLERIRPLCLREFGIDGPGISLDPRENRQCLASLFGLRMIDTIDSIVLLAKRGFVAQGEILYRTLLELLFYFGCVAKSQEAADRFIASFKIERRNTGRKIAKWRHPDLVEARGALPVDEIVRQINEEIQASGIGEKKIAEWAAEAGLEELYLSVYTFLSSGVHSSLSNLERHHFIMSEEGLPVGFRLGPTDDGLARLLAGVAESALMSVACRAAIFGQRQPEEVALLGQEIERLAESWMARESSPEKGE